jgi:hypothetical protein
MYSKLLLTSSDVQVASLAAVDPAVVDVLTAVDVPGVATGPDVAAANTCSTVIFFISGVIAVVSFHAVDGIPAVVAVPAVIILCDDPFKNTVFPPKKLCGLVW